MTRRLLPALLLLLACASLFAGLERLPALTSDEAWMGRYARDFLANGVHSPHEMNTYTGPLYGWLLSAVLGAWGTSIRVLRLPGACLNALAFLLAALHLRRRAGDAAAAWWCVLLASSSYLLLKSRLAWEVYALQPLLLALIFLSLDEPRPLLFAAAVLVGVQNHFIFLAAPASLCALYGARVAWKDEETARPMLRLALSTLAASAVVFLVKPRLSDDAWPGERLWAVPLFFALMPAAAAASRGQWDRPLVAFLRAHARWIGRVLALALTVFAFWHGIPLFQILSGPVLWKRMFSWAAPLPLALVLYLWGALLLVLIVRSAVRAWHQPLPAHERTLALWPVFYAATFVLFRNTTSLRYYSALQYLCLAAAAAGLARLPRPDRRFAHALAAVALLSTQAMFWRELVRPEDRRPLKFKIGWHTENSWDFARKDALFNAFDDAGACVIAHQERSFVAIPLDFHSWETGNVGCDPEKAFDADQCPACETPPYFRWSVEKR